jgi:RNA polymerase sigma-70 factor, ECF subfamily
MTYEEVHLLYDKHASALLGYACAFLGDRAEAEDVLHQVFLNLIRENRFPVDPVPYLFRAVRNTALNVRRQQSRHMQLECQHDWFDAPKDERESALGLQAAVLRLPDEQREVVVLHIWCEMTLLEVATFLGVSPNTVASRYRYGLSKLRESLQHSEGKDGRT